MKKVLCALFLTIAIQQIYAQVFVGTMTTTGTAIQFKIKPTGGNITAAISYFEFNLRYSTANVVTFGTIVPNTTAFPNLSVVDGGERTFNGKKYRRFLAYTLINSQTYTNNTGYTVFEVPLTSVPVGLNLEMATNYNSTVNNDYYFVVSDGNGAPLMNEIAVANNFYPTQITNGDDRYMALANVLPVELLSFKGQNTEGGNLLTWATALEQNISHFDIERSMEGRIFEKVGEVKATGVPSTYTFLDKEPLKGLNYYRLKINDLDKKFDFSKNISIEIKGKTTVKIYPSVTSGDLTIEQAKSYDIVNAAGQIVIERRAKDLPNLVDVVNLSHLATGFYIVKGVDTEGSLFLEKIIKQ